MFGQIVIGPPGSGKSTYCHGMYQFMSAIGRKSCIINLDPANDRLPYPCELDIRDYISLEEIMEELDLGPNGGLMYALESLDKQGIDLFIGKIEQLINESNYLLFDCPGQVELFTHHNSLYRIFKKLTQLKRLRLCVVSLIDCIYLTSPSQYISILLLSLRSMLQLDLPHVNVISKIDMLKNYGDLPFRLDYYTEAQDLQYLTPYLEKESNSVLGQNYVRLTELIGELVEDFHLVSFEVLSVENKKSMISLLSVIDKANGYSFGSEIGGDTIWSEATRQNGSGNGGYQDVDIHERWIDHKEEYDAEERRQEQAFKESLPQEEVDNKPLTEDEEWEAALKDWEEKHGGEGAMLR
ncbi:ATP-binding protein, putative [Candida dubliniensis CD36]|uniref:GPN-loop GTPase 2 n=1 Tax=Candida dubliniensis (strain CD36 / ATCC MYA-646 / CBS 7987 / NCPF 3949 / NRRL Y-17841) TaxID=573826 RepID=B9WHC9_CANDC|nr:ATP-binding protein, putative [Candida dubliniensis CD36]CAX41571.1 ATP-binding protein, putative [Candida dubliniensis CD36]